MNRFLFFFGFFIVALTSCSQNVYYGYPSSELKIKHKDVVVVNIPNHVNGQFKESESLDKLVDFIDSNLIFNITIELNYFCGQEEYCLRYTKLLADDLTILLQERCKDAKLSIVSNGRNNPILPDKTSAKYQEYNTRLEIFIE